MAPSRAGLNIALQLLGREVNNGTAVAACSGAGGGSGALPPGSVRSLQRWSEADFVQHCSAAYCTFQPPPRSTIALSYNCTGTLLASTQ